MPKKAKSAAIAPKPAPTQWSVRFASLESQIDITGKGAKRIYVTAIVSALMIL
jgi:hypothetical protein